MPKGNVSRNKQIAKMLEDHSSLEVGARFSISKQRACKIGNKYGADFIKFRSGIYSDKRSRAEKSELLGTMSDADIARRLKLSVITVRETRKALGIKVYEVPIGCEKCKTDPYAKGLCRNCYSRQWNKSRR
jgi:hypothetical protein